MTDRNLIQVPASKVSKVWTELSTLLPRHLERSSGLMRPEDVFRLVMDGEWQLWQVWNEAAQKSDGFFVTSTRDEVSGRKSLRVELMVGETEREEWLPFLPLIEEWALEAGCDRMEMLVPKPFARDLPDYAMTNVYLERDL